MFKRLRADDADGAELPPASGRWRKMWKLALYLVALLLVIAALNLLSAQAFGDPTCPSTRLGMLMALKAELDSRGIEWFLHYGTLLGAVRDQTIIPWTYDIDVCVPDLQQVRDLLLQMPCFYFRDHPWTEGVGKLYSRGRHLESFGSITGRSYWAEWGWIYYIGRERATVDVYSLYECGAAGNPKCGEAGTNHSERGAYIVGSCQASENRRLPWDDIFPINTTGATINHIKFPAPSNPGMCPDSQLPLLCNTLPCNALQRPATCGNTCALTSTQPSGAVAV